MRIIFETGKPRNFQCGDWYRDGDDIKITTLDMPLKSHVAVAIHELLEMILCEEAGVTDEQVTGFDAWFEKQREYGNQPVTAEAGDDPRAPYKTQHEAATFAERAICAAIGLPWAEHEEAVWKTLE